MKIVADGEDDVKVPAGKRLQPPPLKPNLGFCQPALWTNPMLAGVVQDNAIMTIRASIHVISKRLSTAVHDIPRSPPLIGIQHMAAPVVIKMITKDPLDDARFHPVPSPVLSLLCIRAKPLRLDPPRILLPSDPTDRNFSILFESSW
jgi:hypothetical protein